MSPRRRSRDAASGALGVALSMGVWELLNAALWSVPSPLAAMQQAVVRAAPGPVVSWAIDTLGTANRAWLATGAVAVALGIGAWAGLAARRSPALAVAAFAAAGAVGAAASLSQPETSTLAVLVSATASVGAGLAALRWLLRVGTAASPTSEDSAAGVVTASPHDPPVPRRAFLRAAGGAAAAAALTTAVGRWALGSQPDPVDLGAITLPRPARALPQPDATHAFTDVDGLSPLLTPNDGFYRIDTAIRVPRVDPGTWSLTVGGMVGRELTLSYDDLLDLPLVEVDATMVCVSNEVGGDLVGNARWTGVPLVELLERAGVGAGAEQVVGRAVDGWTGGFPLEAALDGRPALVAVGMNGEPLPTRHGFPARLVVPGLYGYVSATKWLSAIELTDWGFDAYWVPRGWAKEGPVKTASRIDVPADGDRVGTGSVTVAGVAWAPRLGIERVEVRLDDGPWEPAELSAPLSEDTWVQWRRTVELATGDRTLRVRAVDGDGRTQPEGPADPAPDGAEGWHRVSVRAG